MRPSIVEKIADLRELARERASATRSESAPAQLLLWPDGCIWRDHQRGVPNAILRGALFAAIQGKERRALRRELLAVVGGVEIRFTGWQLDQSDLNVWETVIHLARLQQNGLQVEFTAYAMLRTLQLTTGKSAREWLKGVFARLHSAGVEITAGRYTYGGALLTWKRDEITSRYVVSLNLDLLGLFQAGWTRIDWQVRLRLRRKPLALWLHGFYGTHAEPYPYSVGKIRELSGSANRHPASFARQLRKALQELKNEQAIVAYDVGEGVDGLVHVSRTPSSSQRRHLIKIQRTAAEHPSHPVRTTSSLQPAQRHLL